ncbi:outer membrane protein [Bartonella sp. B10]
MNTKRLIAASVFSLITASAAQAADVVVSHRPVTASQPAIVVPDFTWTGFYIGGQAGGFSSKIDMSFIYKDKPIPLSKDLLPSLSGFVGGLYTGCNVDLGDSFVLGVDTDFIWSDKKHTKTILTSDSISGNAIKDNAVARARRSAERIVSGISTTRGSSYSHSGHHGAGQGSANEKPHALSQGHLHAGHSGGSSSGTPSGGQSGSPHGHSYGASSGAGHSGHQYSARNVTGSNVQNVSDVGKNGVYAAKQIPEMATAFGLDNDEFRTLNHTLKQNWAGATRVRVGFAADRIMPYVAGGIAYTQFQDTLSIPSLMASEKLDADKVSAKDVVDETKMMVGYTVGGGVDFAVLDNITVRAEYRYSDFGKKKFAKEKFEIRYKTNDFRVGVAYKF